MTVYHTTLPECIIIKPTLFKDERGYFYESFNEEKFSQLIGQNIRFVQDNQSFSTYGVLRGLHFQGGEHAQAKLVRVLKGEVLDVAVDIRPDSPTFGQHFSIVLSAENRLQLFIPRGFAHGFVVLSEEAEFFYKCDNYYNKESEGSILYSDSDLKINWEISPTDIVISDKDKESGSFLEYRESIFKI